MNRDADELDALIDRATAEIMATADENAVETVMQKLWDSELRPRMSAHTLDALAYTGFAVLTRERLGKGGAQ